MPTLMQAVERLRERGQAPVSGEVCVRALSQQLDVTPRGCVRGLINKALEQTAVRRPWAVILCRYKGELANSTLEDPTEQFYRRVFSSGSGGMVEYWRDVSLGAIDVCGSQIFGWVELEVALADGDTGSGVTRGNTVDYAIAAAQRAGLDPVTGFHSQIAVITRNWSTTNVPAGTPDWGNPNDPLVPWYPFWIDGSADGKGRVTLTPPHNGNILAHEMGHGFGMHHDVGADMVTHYADPCCIMSQQNAFVAPGWDVLFGPALCLPHLVRQGWMFKRRLFVDDGAWLSLSDGISVPLAALTDAGARANLGLQLKNKNADGAQWDYFVEYVQPTAWNRSIMQPTVFIRRLASLPVIGETPIILGSIPVPADGATATFVELSGNVRFDVQRFDAYGRVLRVSARKL